MFSDVFTIQGDGPGLGYSVTAKLLAKYISKYPEKISYVINADGSDRDSVAKLATRTQKELTLIIDASGTTKRENLHSIISESGERGIPVKIIGPAQTVENILTGKTAIIRWDKEALQELALHSLVQASFGRISTLSSFSDLPLRGHLVSPEEKIINFMINIGKLVPGVLIDAINNMLSAANSDENKITQKILNNELDAISKL